MNLATLVLSVQLIKLVSDPVQLVTVKCTGTASSALSPNARLHRKKNKLIGLVRVNWCDHGADVKNSKVS